MHDQPRGPLAIPEEVIQFETGRTTVDWCILLDASDAQTFSHAQLIEHLERIYGLETRWANTVAVRYEAERGIEREVAVPADLVAAMIFKPAARRRFEQLSRTEQHNLVIWLDEATDASERQARIAGLLGQLSTE
ncbi:MAG TPA: YdeI/OmpD-associated family protein [Chloroflexi bacterium]|nr:YdeI/OmpD-associated family protein [Chloroflexota bacterium]